jgi:undecaprenyl-diphosphatase
LNEATGNTTRFLWLGMLCAILFGALAWVMRTMPAVPGDRALIDAVQGWESPGLTSVMLGLSRIGGTGATIVISLVSMLVLYVVVKHRTELVFFAVSVLGSYGLIKLLKWLFHRARPDFHRIIEEEGFSFPSGHAMQAFTLYATLAFLLWRHVPSKAGRAALAAASALLMLAIGTSRVYLGVHYPSDVLGSYAAGACWLCLAVYAFRAKGWLKR